MQLRGRNDYEIYVSNASNSEDERGIFEKLWEQSGERHCAAVWNTSR
jgi:hypothetical protein